MIEQAKKFSVVVDNKHNIETFGNLKIALMIGFSKCVETFTIKIVDKNLLGEEFPVSSIRGYKYIHKYDNNDPDKVTGILFCLFLDGRKNDKKTDCTINIGVGEDSFFHLEFNKRLPIFTIKLLTEFATEKLMGYWYNNYAIK